MCDYDGRDSLDFAYNKFKVHLQDFKLNHPRVYKQLMPLLNDTENFMHSAVGKLNHMEERITKLSMNQSVKY